MANPNPVVPSGTAAGTKSILNLTQPFFGTRRVVVGNRAFASVNTAVQLAKENLGFIGVVKTATKRFPMEPLQKTILPKKGQYTGMSTTGLSSWPMFGPIVTVVIYFDGSFIGHGQSPRAYPLA